MKPRTRDEFVDAVLDLLAERLGNNAPFPGDWARAFAEISEWAGECVSRADHDKALAEDHDKALAEAREEGKAATAELERVKRLSPISAEDVRAVAAKAANDIRREAEYIRTSKRLSKDGAAMRLGWSADKLEAVSK